MENVDDIDRVKEELNQLEIKKKQVADFINSEKFKTLPETHKFWIEKELYALIGYKNVLKQQLKLFESEN